jgi:hypothetical protein
MKAAILTIAGVISLQVLSSMAADTVVIIPAFQNFFAGPNQPVVAVTTRNTVGTQSGLIPSQGGAASVNTTPNATTARRGQALDPTIMNVPVFPEPVVVSTDAGVVVFPQGAGMGFAPITNMFGQVVGAGASVTDLPPRTTGAGVATNALPFPAAPRPEGSEFNPAGTIPPSPGQGVAPPQPPGTPVTPPQTPGIPPARNPFNTGTPTDATPAPASPRPNP